MRHIVTLETKQKISVANTGKKRTEEDKQRQSIRMMGENNPNYGKKHPYLAEYNREKARNGGFSGENHWNWKDGRTPLVEKIRYCLKYRTWRDNIYTRDNFICQKCSKRGNKLHAHHIKYFSAILEENKIGTLEQSYDCAELWSLNNGITLCKPCHIKIHKKEK